MAVSLGCHLCDAVLPYPDIRDTMSAIAGARKRLVPEVKRPDRELLRDFRTFCRKWNHDNLTPLAMNTDVSLETWLSRTNYTETRKEELRSVWASTIAINKSHYRCKSFIKAESYTDFKYPRCINSRSDAFKCFTGPIFKAIEDVVYQNPYFIKHVSVPNRAEFISRMAIPGYEYIATDHSSFEARISSKIMKACELQLYSYMTQLLPNGDEFMYHVSRALPGINVCQFKGFDVEVPGNRMSGDMCTSLGNGYTNLMSMLFLSCRRGFVPEGVVEGDDGLFAFPPGMHPTVEDYAQLGFDIKLKSTNTIGDAGFCGMYFADEHTNVVDVRALLCKFGWTDSQQKCAGQRKLLGLLKAKALSLLYEVPHCPIALSLGKYVLRMTKWVKPIYDSTGRTVYTFKQQRALESRNSDYLACVINPCNRELVERLFEVTVEEQIKIEEYFDNCSKLQPIPLWITNIVANDVWRNAAGYCMNYPRRLIS